MNISKKKKKQLTRKSLKYELISSDRLRVHIITRRRHEQTTKFRIDIYDKQTPSVRVNVKNEIIISYLVRSFSSITFTVTNCLSRLKRNIIPRSIVVWTDNGKTRTEFVAERMAALLRVNVWTRARRLYNYYSKSISTGRTERAKRIWYIRICF